MIRGDWYKLVETEPKVDKFVTVWLGAEDSWGSFGGLLGVEHFVVAATVRSAYLLFSPKNLWQISILTAIKYFRPSFTQDSQNDTCALILAPSKGAIWVVSCTDCSEYDQVASFNVCGVVGYRNRREKWVFIFRWQASFINYLIKDVHFIFRIGSICLTAASFIGLALIVIQTSYLVFIEIEFRMV